VNRPPIGQATTISLPRSTTGGLREPAPTETEERDENLRLYSIAAVGATAMLLSPGATFAQQGPPGCAWKKYMYAQDATQQGKIDTSLLNEMSGLVSAQGYTLTSKVWQLCNGWLMEAKRANGSTAILYVEPKTKTVVDVDFSA
jgi:hypothetical protein